MAGMGRLKNVKISILIVLTIAITAAFRHGFDWLTLLAIICALTAITLEVAE
jgi:hypothetical protein